MECRYSHLRWFPEVFAARRRPLLALWFLFSTRCWPPVLQLGAGLARKIAADPTSISGRTRARSPGRYPAVGLAGNCSCRSRSHAVEYGLARVDHNQYEAAPGVQERSKPFPLHGDRVQFLLDLRGVFRRGTALPAHRRTRCAPNLFADGRRFHTPCAQQVILRQALRACVAGRR